LQRQLWIWARALRNLRTLQLLQLLLLPLAAMQQLQPQVQELVLLPVQAWRARLKRVQLLTVELRCFNGLKLQNRWAAAQMHFKCVPKCTSSALRVNLA
jgi:hypothetical protein